MHIPISDNNDDAKIRLSPMIDCVFLLLIFFLVTTMIKRQERQIPVILPESGVSVSETKKESVYIIGIDKNGGFYKQAGYRKEDGAVTYSPISDLSLFLKELAETKKIFLPITLSVDRETPTRHVIKGLDICRIQGFTTVDVRIRDFKTIHPETGRIGSE